MKESNNDGYKWKSPISVVYTMMKTRGWDNIKNNLWTIQKWGRHLLEISGQEKYVWKFKYNKNYICCFLFNSFGFDICFNKKNSDFQFGVLQPLILFVGV